MDRQFVFGDLEKEQFVRYLREYEAFCGVQVITFCVMSNHFHILLKVPPPPDVLPSNEELLARVEALSGLGGSLRTRQEFEMLQKAGDQTGVEALRKRILARMWDVSAFMKLLKQRFSTWFNGTHDRQGTLWEERFRSTLVEGSGRVLATVASYIDLNPIRAGIVDDPKDYRWSGYAEAMAGKPKAQEGLHQAGAAWMGRDPQSTTPQEALKCYRICLFGQGEQEAPSINPNTPARKGIARETVKQVLQTQGRVSLAEYLRLKVRYFNDGVVVGSRSFVNSIFHAQRHRYGKNRKTGARRMRGVLSEDLFSMRDLRLHVLE